MKPYMNEAAKSLLKSAIGASQFKRILDSIPTEAPGDEEAERALEEVEKAIANDWHTIQQCEVVTCSTHTALNKLRTALRARLRAVPQHTPHTIRAIQFTGKNFDEIRTFAGNPIRRVDEKVAVELGNGNVVVAMPTDWIVEDGDALQTWSDSVFLQTWTRLERDAKEETT